MKIYTKKGDRGKTSLGSGIKAWKDSKRVDAYGTIDELNALLGVIESDLNTVNKKYARFFRDIIITVQNDLFCIGSYLSNPANVNFIKHLNRGTLLFEEQIDKMTKKMPELNNFILPGGTKTAANLQLARAVSRRAERKIVTISKKEKINADVIQYINRLSDLLFTMSRYANYKEKKKEMIWSRR